MNTNHENPWMYASTIIKNLTDSGYFANEENATDVVLLFKNIAKWSKINLDIYGECSLDELQYSDILTAVRCQSVKKSINALHESETISVGVSETGHLVYRLSTNGVNLKDSLVVNTNIGFGQN